MSNMTASTVPSELQPGRRVEVCNQFDQRWTRGFEIVEVHSDGLVLRRVSDGSVLPTRFDARDVRRERRKGMWWA